MRLLHRIFYIINTSVFIRRILFRFNLLLWMMKRKSVPPPNIIKQNVVRTYGRVFNINILIETGTYMGDMVNAQRKYFREIYSVELNERLFNIAKKRFSRFKHIHLVYSDSQKFLPYIVTKISEPCLFWLDAHYSGGVTARGNLETPIIQELTTISQHYIKNHVILIDDARLFDGTNDYPDIKKLEEKIKSLFPASNINIDDDIIRVTPKNVRYIRIQQ